MTKPNAAPAEASTGAGEAPTGISGIVNAPPAKPDAPVEAPRVPAVETPPAPPPPPAEPKVSEPAKPEESETDEVKPGAGEPAKADAEISVKLPEGAVADEALLGEFVPLAKELGLDSAKSQKLIDLYAKQQAARAVLDQKSWTDVQKGYVDTITSDSELGGTKLEATRRNVESALKTFNPKLAVEMDRLGLGNFPELVRFCARVGIALGDDSTAGTSGSNTPAPMTPDEALIASIYTHPTSRPKE